MHGTYTRDAFSHFDSRTVNIERALNDLDPLLRIYTSDDAPNQTRLDDLRMVLKRGAAFAFTLFAQPSFWQLDWSPPTTNKEQEEENGETEKRFSQGNRQRASVEGRVTPEELVIWPALLRVMNGEGQRVEEGQGVKIELGKKQLLMDFI